ncbi:MAG: glycosyltransferase family 4 protein [Saprospiraceae bacterium]|nr:glycosyltransferase family 4 protein [Saprospiraceae bacterium]
MNILFVSHKYPPAVGGMEKQSFELINGMKKYAQVHLMAIQNDSQISFILKTRKQILSYLHNHPEIDIIHINDGLLACILGPIIKHLPLIKVATIHGLEASYPGALYTKYIFSRLKVYDKLICVSQHTKELCIQKGLVASQLEVIHNGVAESSQKPVKPSLATLPFDIPKDKTIIVSVGRLVKRKGFYWFASTVMPELGKDYQYIIIGNYFKESLGRRIFNFIAPGGLVHKYNLLMGYPSDNVPLQAQKFDNVILAGRLSDEQMLGVLERADLFIVPNIPVKGDAEGFGLVALEGTIAQKTVLASNLEGLKDVIKDGSNGYVLPAMDKNAWVGKIKELSIDKIALKAFGQKAKTYSLQNFSWEKMSFEYFQTFEKLNEQKIQNKTLDHTMV